ncbi:MAG TPA: ArsA-related P-loop ATPase [Acidimicrobiales bacterium]|nr:ArsA-related P-loop ATPase [Acidimicrobiales bacterium]
MDIAAFCRQSRVLVIAGKGGVGKTTITAALARMAARAGLDVLVVELEGKPGVTTAFGGTGPLAYTETTLTAGPGPLGIVSDDGQSIAVAGSGAAGAGAGAAGAGAAGAGAGGAGAGGPGGPGGEGTVHARRITPDDALLEYLAEHGMGRISKRLVSSGALDVVSTAIPGIRDILVLGKIKQLEREAETDLILVDAPATGHAMTFLSSAQGLLDAARSGPVRAQAADVVELLSDPDRCQVALVTLPEEMPVNEVIEAAYQLEDKVGLTLGPVIVNGCLSDDPRLAEDPAAAAGAVGVTLSADQIHALAAAAAFRASRYDLQRQQRRRLGDELPLFQIQAPIVFSDTIGPREIERIADALADGVESMGADTAPTVV